MVRESVEQVRARVDAEFAARHASSSSSVVKRRKRKKKRKRRLHVALIYVSLVLALFGLGNLNVISRTTTTTTTQQQHHNNHENTTTTTTQNNTQQHKTTHNNTHNHTHCQVGGHIGKCERTVGVGGKHTHIYRRKSAKNREGQRL